MYELLILVTLIQVKCPRPRRLFLVKNAFLFVLFTMIVKNVVPLFSFSFIYFCFCLKK